jgi:SAM-dependent methyltransferase
MKHLFYDEWKNKRVSKILNIFGKNWFKKKEILELGCAHGDVGFEFLKLGSNVVFSDAREEFIKGIRDKISEYNYKPDCALVDQNKDYNFNKKFDLVIHMGVLYHLENWENDLKCALSNTDAMILETIVGTKNGFYINNENYKYDSYSKRVSIFTQENIEEHLKSLGCKFIRFDDPELNCSGWLYNGEYIENIYDWDYWNYEIRMENTKGRIHHRRMWLVLK